MREWLPRLEIWVRKYVDNFVTLMVYFLQTIVKINTGSTIWQVPPQAKSKSSRASRIRKTSW
jgi:hypothetical protein